jgi:hypothetical protein
MVYSYKPPRRHRLDVLVDKLFSEPAIGPETAAENRDAVEKVVAQHFKDNEIFRRIQSELLDMRENLDRAFRRIGGELEDLGLPEQKRDKLRAVFKGPPIEWAKGLTELVRELRPDAPEFEEEGEDEDEAA